MARDPVGRAEHRAVALARPFDRTPPRGRIRPARPARAGDPDRRAGDRRVPEAGRRRRRRRSRAEWKASSGRKSGPTIATCATSLSFYAGCTSQYRLPSEVNIVGESAYVLAIAKFLVGDLGLNPGAFVLTENPPESERAAIVAAFRGLAPGIDGDPVFEPDGWRARELIARRTASANIRSYSDRPGRRPSLATSARRWSRSVIRPPTKWCWPALTSAIAARCNSWSGPTPRSSGNRPRRTRRRRSHER